MLTVGLTGGIASGKSHVLRRFAAAGLKTIDLDQVSRVVMAPDGAAYASVVARFGRGILAPDGSIDRGVLGKMVFADAGARRSLESIVHPLVRAAEGTLLAAAGGGIAAVDAALLVETGAHLRFDRLVVVYCDPDEQLCRLMARDGISHVAARARIDAQMAADEKRGFAHFVIDASDAVADTDARADAVISSLRALDGAPVTAPVPPERAYAMLERGPHDGPRGLTPWRVAEAMASAGTFDVARLAALLHPAHSGPWYEAADGARPAIPPESLAVPVAVYCAGRRPADLAYTTAAAFTLARLTHREGAALAGAIVAALGARQALVFGQVARHDVGALVEAATRWAGVRPPSSVIDTVAAAAAHAGDRESAARAAQLAGGLPQLARALAGGPPPRAVPADRLQVVARLLGTAAV